jgi:NTP pyrophosphatase (non-canonical NTP hydrolase)
MNKEFGFNDLLQFINTEDERLINYFECQTKNERILSRTVKLTEELGELCNEILAYNGYQRKEKLLNHDKDNIPNEFADVIITTILLAKTMDVDIKEALKNKINKINKRDY